MPESTPAGQPYTTTVSAPSAGSIAVTINGRSITIFPTSVGGDRYEFTISGGDVKCPGPIVISGLNGPDKTVQITGCPD